jgi:Asp-tRNA(Asn)/Glu-tRNA(Gln) amidotransferase A subunit family amidase
VALGSETDGSIICPSNRAALYGIKPTVGLVSRAGVIPISHTQDTVPSYPISTETRWVLWRNLHTMPR